MATQVVTVPVGSPQVFNINQPGGFGCILAQPGAGGTVLIEYSADGVNYVADGRGVSGVAVCLGQGTFGPGFFTKARVTAATAAAIATAMDLNPRMLVVAQSGTAFATRNATSEDAIFAMRFPAGMLKPNFVLDIDAVISCTNSAGVKTMKAYFGNAPATGATLVTGVLTSLPGGRLGLRIAGRSDGATIVGGGQFAGIAATTTQQATGATFAGGSAVEQELLITSTKATGSETLTLDAITVTLTQGQLP